MSLSSGYVIQYEDIKTKIITDIKNFCLKYCVNVGNSIQIQDVLRKVSVNEKVQNCFNPNLTNIQNYIYKMGNGGSKFSKFEKPNFTSYKKPWVFVYKKPWWPAIKKEKVINPHIKPGSDIGFRNLYYVISTDEVSLLSGIYTPTDVENSIKQFLTKFNVDLKDKIMTTKDMIHFFCCMMTFVEYKVLKVSGGSGLQSFNAPTTIAYYFNDCSNDGIVIKSIDNISISEFSDIDNVMNLFNSRINTHHIKYTFIESKT